MAIITTLGTSDSGSTSRTVINDNFTNLNTDKIETSVISTDGTLAGNSDTELPTEQAVKTYVDTNGGASFADTEVWTGIPPNTWTDLDLSSVVGVAQRMVLLRIYNADAADRNFTFRTNGDTNEYQGTANLAHGGACSALVDNGKNGTVLVKTDSSGVVEWQASTTGTTGSTIDVLAYW